MPRGGQMEILCTPVKFPISLKLLFKKLLGKKLILKIMFKG